ncbi:MULTISPECIES: hypothetical protein [Pseudanabaena]|uniref:hypothetical protein n=1 Tax=Pseudanabaena TaxID=1152 RepID=UPI00247A27C1|nr:MULTISPECIES: hypothetical protein [Pseudanabaena]MEA5488995.1 hypothetical protein [Pseudanabaena sp. CCNP1317]WGS73329.1 hypothetical protein OA858_04670 [Pseudanabaena galeata CCNP1313]
MFNSRNLLVGLVAASVSFGVGNWSGAIASNTDRYPTTEEVRRLAQEFERNVIPSVQRSRQFGLGERSRQLDAFVRDWSKVDPEVAPFLGSWNKTVSDFMIYPSSSKGRACVVFTLPSRPSGKLDAFFAIASISNGYLQLKPNGWNNNFLSSGGTLIRNGNYLGIASVEQGKQNIRLQSAFSDPLRPITSLPLANTVQNKQVLQQFSDAGCTASLPSQVSNSHSNGYLSDQEIESIQPSKYILRQLHYYIDNRSRYKIEQITQFRNDWSTLDPSLAPFLGQWQGYERSMVSIYPSSTKGKSCVITSFGDDVRDSSGIRTVYTHTFGIGKISGNKLLVETENGEKFVVLQQVANTKNGRINILAALAKVSEENSFFAFAFPRLLEPFRPEKLRQFGCTTLPPQNSSRNNDRAIPSIPTDTIAKYPTNNEFKSFENKLRGNPESLVKLRGNQADQRRKFQNEWKARNPNAAKFLGAWYTGGRYFYVFPSTAKGGTCVVTQDANGNLDMKIGVVLNQELRYDGGKGFFWRDRPNIIAARDSGSGSLYPIYATFGMPELSESMIGDMERQKCVTTLPK